MTRSLWNTRTTIHRNLCISLLVAELLFLLGVERTENAVRKTKWNEPRTDRHCGVILLNIFVPAKRLNGVQCQPYSLLRLLTKLWLKKKKKRFSSRLEKILLIVRSSYITSKKKYYTCDSFDVLSSDIFLGRWLADWIKPPIISLIHVFAGFYHCSDLLRLTL